MALECLPIDSHLNRMLRDEVIPSCKRQIIDSATRRSSLHTHAIHHERSGLVGMLDFLQK